MMSTYVLLRNGKTLQTSSFEKVSARNLYLTLLASVDDNTAIIPHHFEHYRKAGILPENMIIALDSASYNETSLQYWEQYYRKRGVTPERFPANWTSCLGFQWTVDVLARWQITHSSQWVIVTDADELVRFPGGTALSLAQQLHDEGATHAYGNMVDRVAENGSLSSLQPPEVASIADQYPLSCRITSLIAGGRTRKIPIHRGDLRTSSGHHHLWVTQRLLRYTPFSSQCTRIPNEHQVPSLEGIPWSWSGPLVPIDHYKWNSGALAKLVHRLTIQAETSGYKKEIAKAVFSIYENGGRFPVDHPALGCVRSPIIY
jgi:hypothetical protein